MALCALVVLASCGDDEKPRTDAGPTDGGMDVKDASPQGDGPSDFLGRSFSILAVGDLEDALDVQSGPDGTIYAGESRGFVEAGGLSNLASFIEARRSADASDGPYRNMMVVSAGDLLGPRPRLSSLFQHEPTFEGIEFNLAVVGTHELDEGVTELMRLRNGCHAFDGCMTRSGFDFVGSPGAFLSANVSTGPDTTLFPPYSIAFGEIAFIGVSSPDTPSALPLANTSGLQFNDPVAAINALVPELLAKSVSVIIIVAHDNGSTQTGAYDGCEGLTGPIVALANGVSDDVDVIIAGGTASPFNCVVDGKIVTSAASYGRVLTQVEIFFPSWEDGVRIAALNHIIEPDPYPSTTVSGIVTRYEAIAAPHWNRVVGHLAAPLTRTAVGSTQTTLGCAAADALLEATSAAGTGNAVIAFADPHDLDADLASTEVTYATLTAAFSRGSRLHTVSLTGAQIEQLLEAQWGASASNVLSVSAGFSYAFSASAPVGARVDPASITLNGNALGPSTAYRVTFIGDRAPPTGRFVGVFDRAAFEAYLVAHDPLAAPLTNRVTALP